MTAVLQNHQPGRLLQNRLKLLRQLRNVGQRPCPPRIGQSDFEDHVKWAYNYRMTDIQAARRNQTNWAGLDCIGKKKDSQQYNGAFADIDFIRLPTEEKTGGVSATTSLTKP